MMMMKGLEILGSGKAPSQRSPELSPGELAHVGQKVVR